MHQRRAGGRACAAAACRAARWRPRPCRSRGSCARRLRARETATDELRPSPMIEHAEFVSCAMAAGGHRRRARPGPSGSAKPSATRRDDDGRAPPRRTATAIARPRPRNGAASRRHHAAEPRRAAIDDQHALRPLRPDPRDQEQAEDQRADDRADRVRRIDPPTVRPGSLAAAAAGGERERKAGAPEARGRQHGPERSARDRAGR